MFEKINEISGSDSLAQSRVARSPPTECHLPLCSAPALFGNELDGRNFDRIEGQHQRGQRGILDHFPNSLRRIQPVSFPNFSRVFPRACLKCAQFL